MNKIVPRQTWTRQGTSRSIASGTPAELCLSDQERSLPGQLDNHPVGADELITRTSLTASQVLATLSVQELKRLVRRLPGHQFVRA
jgi:DNA processing protein